MVERVVKFLFLLSLVSGLLYRLLSLFIPPEWRAVLQSLPHIPPEWSDALVTVCAGLNVAMLIIFVVGIVWVNRNGKKLIQREREQDAAFAARYPPLVKDEKGNSLCPECNLPFQSDCDVYAHIKRWHKRVNVADETIAR